MGRKRRLPARAREKLVAEEAASAIELERKEAVLQSKPDKALFVLDAAGSGRKRQKIQKAAKTPKHLSKNEKKLIVDKYLRKGKAGPSKLPQRISDPWAEDDEVGEGVGDAGKDVGKEALPSTDEKRGAGEGSALVSREERGDADEGGGYAVGKASRRGGDGFEPVPRVPGRNTKRPKQSARNLAKLGVCHPGQSYNPTEEDHDDVLASAVAVELKRQEAIEEELAPISAGMSKETLAVIVGDEDDESSSGEDDGDKPAVSLGKPTSASGKLTRAQRNKQKRVKAAKLELTLRRNKKEMSKSIDQLVAIEKDLADQERTRQERRQMKRLFKAEKAKLEEEGAAAGGIFGPSAGVAAMSAKRLSNRDIIAGRSVPVNLGEELHGSLRQLKAQGSILLDKVELLKKNKAHPDRRRGKERAQKAPKGYRKKHTYKDRYKDD